MNIAGTDLRVLRVFEVVARQGGFAAAQTELNISLSTISNHIAALEARLGVKLCQRGRSGFQITEKGEIVLEATERLFQSLDEFSTNVGELRGNLLGNLKIGIVDCTVTDPNSKLHEAVAAFNTRPNSVTIHISQNSPQILQKNVQDGVLHLGIGSFPHKISGLTYEPLYDEPHSLYCGTGHPLFHVPDHDIDLAALKKNPIIGRGYWRDEYSKNLGFDNVTAVIFEIEPQLSLILSGCYIGLLPDHYARSWVANGRLRCLVPEAVSYSCRFELILKKGYRRTKKEETFLKALRQAYQTDVATPK